MRSKTKLDHILIWTKMNSKNTKGSYTGLKWHEREKIMTVFIFGWTKFLSVSQSYLFFLCGTEIIDGSCEKQRSHTGFKVEGCRSPVGSLGRWCVMVVLVPQCPLSAALRAQLLGHAASICLQQWGATHHQHSQSITPRVKSKLSSSTRALRA